MAPPTSPTGRLPVHLFFNFDRPGEYRVRYVLVSDWHGSQQAAPKYAIVSDWVTLEMKSISDEEQQTWERKMIDNPPRDADLLVGDVLPSLFAHPDDTVLPFCFTLPQAERVAAPGLRAQGEETLHTFILFLGGDKGERMKNAAWFAPVNHAAFYIQYFFLYTNPSPCSAVRTAAWHFSVAGTMGRRGPPTSMPIMLRPAFSGTGLGSTNSAFASGSRR